MRRGYLFYDSRPTSFRGVKRQKAAVPKEMQKPVLEERNIEEMVEEETFESKQKQNGYNVLVDERGDERDNYEEDESATKRNDIVSAIEVAKQQSNITLVTELENLLKRFDEEESAGEKDWTGAFRDDETLKVADNPPLQSKTVEELLKDFDEVENGTKDTKDTVLNNLTSKLTSTFQKNLEQLGGATIQMDSVDMHEYAKLVNASYQYFEHRDFNKTREYMTAAENAYIPHFNEWQVNETYSSADDLVFVKYGRDLNNPTVVIACRGTATASDWSANLSMVAGGTEQVQRFKQLEDTFHKVKAQFPTANIQVTGHSQGGGLSYALAQKYNLRGYHFDPAVFPTFRENVVKQTARTWGSSPLTHLTGDLMRYDSRSSRQSQYVYKNAADPVSMMMTLLDTEKNVRVKTVDVRATPGAAVNNPHSLSNYYVEGYDGDVSKGVPVLRGGNTRKIVEPILKRAVLTKAVRAAGAAGQRIAVGMTVNDTYHALKSIEEDDSLSNSEKRTKQWLKTGENVANFTVSAGVGMSAEAAAATMLTGMGLTGAVAIGAPLLMGAAAAVIASEAIKWIGGTVEKHSATLSHFVDPQLIDVADVPRKKKRKIVGGMAQW